MLRIKHSFTIFCVSFAGFSAAASLTPSAHAGQDYEMVSTAEGLAAIYTDKMFLGEYREYRRTKTYYYTEFHRDDGKTDYVEGARIETGRWVIKNDRVCYNYPEGTRPDQTFCYYTFNQGGCYYQYSARRAPPALPAEFKAWNARGVIKGSRASCEEPVS